jgi:hypothetical protein
MHQYQRTILAEWFVSLGRRASRLSVVNGPGTVKNFDSEKVERALNGALVYFKFLR